MRPPRRERRASRTSSWLSWIVSFLEQPIDRTARSGGLAFDGWKLAGFHEALEAAEILLHLLFRLLAEQLGNDGSDDACRRVTIPDAAA